MAISFADGGILGLHRAVQRPARHGAHDGIACRQRRVARRHRRGRLLDRVANPDLNGATLGVVAWMLSYAVEAAVSTWRLRRLGWYAER